MQVILHQLIERYHQTTTFEANRTRLDDSGAIAAAAGQVIENRQETIAGWIRKYGVSRVRGFTIEGDYTPFAQAMAKEALDYFDRESFDDKSDASVAKHFAHLRAAFGEIYRKDRGKDDRKMLSLTSKVLWLRMPTEAPIFDSQAETAIIFLGKLLKAQTWKRYKTGDEGITDEGTCKVIDEKWGWGPRVDLPRPVLDNYWYQDFLHSHRRIYEKCGAEIERRLVAEGLNWLTSFRYFDKLLWVFGDEGRDYSLMRDAGETFKSFAGPQLRAHVPESDDSVA